MEIKADPDILYEAQTEAEKEALKKINMELNGLTVGEIERIIYAIYSNLKTAIYKS